MCMKMGMIELDAECDEKRKEMEQAKKIKEKSKEEINKR